MNTKNLIKVQKKTRGYLALYFNGKNTTELLEFMQMPITFAPDDNNIGYTGCYDNLLCVLPGTTVVRIVEEMGKPTRFDTYATLNLLHETYAVIRDDL